MPRITVRPAWTFISETGERVEPQLFDVLRAINDTGKLTLAAGQVNLSYRHAWDLLDKWSAFFGSPLVRMERGKGAKLTALGERLLWAEQRIDASLFPQLENVASELNLEINRALKAIGSVIHLHASHGYAVEKLPALMDGHGHAGIELKYMGSADAIASLCRGGCELAGFHVPLGEMAEVSWQQYAKWIRPRQQRIIRLVIRTQGLILPKGNPLAIRSLADLTRAAVRFVNRQHGSGTRMLLDGLLAAQKIDPRRIRGYDTGEFTHAAVAAFVASGMADAAFGVEPAARQFKLDFIPMVKERYMMLCRTDTLRQACVQELVSLLKGPEFAGMMRPVAGYALDMPGEVADVRDLLPREAA